MDLNIGRVFSTAETDLENALKTVGPEITADVKKILGVAKTSVANAFDVIAPTLEDDITKLETTIETGLNLFAETKVGPLGAGAEAAAVNPVIQAAGATAIAKIQTWVANNSK